MTTATTHSPMGKANHHFLTTHIVARAHTNGETVATWPPGHVPPPRTDD